MIFFKYKIKQGRDVVHNLSTIYRFLLTIFFYFKLKQYNNNKLLQTKYYVKKTLTKKIDYFLLRVCCLSILCLLKKKGIFSSRILFVLYRSENPCVLFSSTRIWCFCMYQWWRNKLFRVEIFEYLILYLNYLIFVVCVASLRFFLWLSVKSFYGDLFI